MKPSWQPNKTLNILFGVSLVVGITLSSIKFYYLYQDRKKSKCKCEGNH